MASSKGSGTFNWEDLELNVANKEPCGVVAKGDLHKKLAQTTQRKINKHNHPHICRFWVKGKCKRGEGCPYRHERPTHPDDPLTKQNKDRYHGANDPVTDKLLRRAAKMPKLYPPEDKTITTLYVGNTGEQLTEGELREYFSQFGEIRSVTMLTKRNCAFIHFTNRSSAEAAVVFRKLICGGRRIKIEWGKSQTKVFTASSKESEKKFKPVPALSKPLSSPPEELANLPRTPVMMQPLPPTPVMMQPLPPPSPFYMEMLHTPPPLGMSFPPHPMFMSPYYHVLPPPPFATVFVPTPPPPFATVFVPTPPPPMP